MPGPNGFVGGTDADLVMIAAAVLCAAVLLAAQAGNRQTWVRYQAEAYELLFRQAPALCGELPAGSRVDLQVDPQMHDFLGGFTSMALNLLYDDALVERADPGDLTSATGVTAGACTLRYDHGRYTHPAD
jgi:hypothetical protein